VKAHHAEITLLMDALAFSAAKHRNQRRKDVDASPYINHRSRWPTCWRSKAASPTTDARRRILHDTLEDTETTYES